MRRHSAFMEALFSGGTTESSPCPWNATARPGSPFEPLDGESATPVVRMDSHPISFLIRVRGVRLPVGALISFDCHFSHEPV